MRAVDFYSSFFASVFKNLFQNIVNIVTFIEVEFTYILSAVNIKLFSCCEFNRIFSLMIQREFQGTVTHCKMFHVRIFEFVFLEFAFKMPCAIKFLEKFFGASNKKVLFV